MKTIRFSGIIFICMLFLSVSCKECSALESVNTITINNNSDTPLVMVVSKVYPDTLLPIMPDHIAGIRPHGSTFFDTKEEWADFFADLPADTLSVFFIKGTVFDSLSMETIRNQNLVLKRKDLSFKEVLDSNFIIAYP